ncbi:agmatinase [Klebsiella variicola]|nr:agmatinase [Klebsiella variicola]
MSTLGHQYDNSLVSNAFGFLRLPMNFMPYESDADWVITGVPFDMATSGRAGGRHGRRLSVRFPLTSPGAQPFPVEL